MTQALKSLDLSVFKKSLELVALKVPIPLINSVKSKLKNYSSKVPNCPAIFSIAEDKTLKGIYLHQSVTDTELTGVPDDVKTFLKENSISAFKAKVELDYKSFTIEEMLRVILPAEIEAISSFETIGHIAHLNLRDHHMPYKHKIAEAILIKTPQIKTVINKIGTITSEFRTFNMELLAGEDNLNAEVHESGCTFRMNYAEVYWNSRLQMEHKRLIDLFNKDDIICDMFAGIGPFAVPAAKKCKVYANDLNPRSVHYMNENAKLNHVTKNIKTYNMDARDFVRELQKEGIEYTQVIMNLPADSISFLDVFKEVKNKKQFTIHVYGFSAAETSSEIEKDVLNRIEIALQRPFKTQSIIEVRHVAPKKYMMCISFHLPLFEESISSEPSEPACKKAKKE